MKLVPILLLVLVGGALCATGAGVVTAALVVPLLMACPSLALLIPIAGAVATHVFIVVGRRKAPRVAAVLELEQRARSFPSELADASLAPDTF